ncbi:conserved hypothetical protein [Pseudomonas sp. OF001]|uniref:hypothetical protein n=1 Tax=unclassified Pseudomonas TaxID=196821 RepID=UPI0010A6B211|nr:MULTISPECIES: hypothetical protein [unclassified Pseudomonas]THG86865.1 hypothetical protein E5198_01450 [Pseudomonas sp. A-1]WPP45403.1 hypothetical protein SK095_19510 [Pseudomonas sp. AN-1]CAD5375646.1 conserved hypothetical protein [Pseudomonas sp. OF001]
MSLQVLWSLCQSYPAQVVNGLALFLALAGGWLLLATRLREQRAQARPLLEGELSGMTADALAGDVQVARLNRFFYAFGSACLAAALGLSWLSTGLQAAL